MKPPAGFHTFNPNDGPNLAAEELISQIGWNQQPPLCLRASASLLICWLLGRIMESVVEANLFPPPQDEVEGAVDPVVEDLEPDDPVLL